MISFNVLIADFDLTSTEKRKIWLTDSIHSEGKSTGEIAFILCDDEYLSEINSKYLHHDTLTDIITFSNSTNPSIISGDIFISIDRIYDNAKSLNLAFEIELNRVLIHGVLHLIGYNDHTNDQKLLMRTKEDYYLHLQP